MNNFNNAVLNALFPTTSTTAAAPTTTSNNAPALASNWHHHHHQLTLADYPDLCGGTVGAPGNCTQSICHGWIQALDAALPPISFPIGSRRLSMDSFMAPAVSEVLNARKASSSYSNTYSSNGYEPLAISCADSSNSQSAACVSYNNTVLLAANNSKNVVGIVAGCIVAVALVAVIALIVIR